MQKRLQHYYHMLIWLIKKLQLFLLLKLHMEITDHMDIKALKPPKHQKVRFIEVPSNKVLYQISMKPLFSHNLMKKMKITYMMKKMQLQLQQKRLHQTKIQLNMKNTKNMKLKKKSKRNQKINKTNKIGIHHLKIHFPKSYIQKVLEIETIFEKKIKKPSILYSQANKKKKMFLVTL